MIEWKIDILILILLRDNLKFYSFLYIMIKFDDNILKLFIK